MGENRDKIKELGKEIIENIFAKRSSDIYTLNEDDELKIAERDKIRCQDALLCFLKENLPPASYDIAFDYINSLSEKENALTGIWNQRFYMVGFKDGVKIF